MSRELGAECWLLTGLGRVIGGTGPSLPRPLALRLACEYLRADRMPATGVSVAGRARESTRCSGWAASRGSPAGSSPARAREQDWPHELRESVAELAADVALERARLNAARTGDGKLAEAIVTMLASGGGDGAPRLAEIASLMRAAGLPPDGRYLVAAVTAEADRVTGPNAERWRCDLAGELVWPAAEDALVAPLGDEIVVLVPAPGDWPGRVPDESPDDGASAAHRFAATIRAAQPVVESDRSRIRLAVGVSGSSRERDRAARRAARGGQRAAAGRAAAGRAGRHLGHLGRDQRRGGLARAPAGHRARPACCARSASACSARCWPTTTSTGPSCCRRCGSSWPAPDRGTHARSGCMSTSTPSATGSGGSRS